MREGAAMTVGLVAVIIVTCIPLLSDGVSMGRVSSNGSKPGLSGKILANPNTLRSVYPPSPSTFRVLVLVCPIGCRELDSNC